MAALAVCSCNVSEINDVVSADSVFTATTEAYISDGVETKTSMDSEGNVLWKAGDQLSVFAASTINEHYQVTDASDGKTTASLYQVESPGFVAGGEIPNNVAFYPYAANTGIAKRSGGYVISDITLPATQTYAQASFGNGAFPMAAVTASTSDMNLKFKNVLGGLKLRLTGTAAIATISISGNSNEILCGAAEVAVADGSLPSISLTDASAKTVTLDCGNGVQLSETAATAFIIALPPMTMTGGFTVTVSDTQGASMEIKTTKTQTITRSNLLAMPAVNYVGTPIAQGPEAVDLGLPSGLKWATCNVGANAPEEYGDYFAWGDTEPYYTEGHSQDSPCSDWKDGKSSGYFWPSHQWYNGDYDILTKYNYSSSYGTIDNKTILDPEDDAAYVNWGGSWRMPTDEEWSELIQECTWTWTTQNGVDGRLVTGPNGNSIFLPAAGFRYDTELYLTGNGGVYWSSSLSTNYPSNALYVELDSEVVYMDYFYRCLGQSVRPVSDDGVRVSVTGISLDKSSLALAVEETETITATVSPSNATQNNVIWSSSNTAVATVSWQGVVTAIAFGTATITATTYDGGYTATCAVTVFASAPASASAVDLGLTSGLKWASCNVGATAPEEYGDYFAWGEIGPYYSSLNPLTWKTGKSKGYDWSSYQWCNGSSYTITKYNTDSSYGPVVDNMTSLELEDDIARANWGDTWRMPTEAEWWELITNCTWTLITQNGVKGSLITGPNGSSIFLPAAGYCYNNSLYDAGTEGDYWSSSIGREPYHACNLLFYADEVNEVYTGSNSRCMGLPVRPVTE